MGCFDNLLGVRGLCEPDDPSSTIFMDDVGLTKFDLNSFMTSQYTDEKDYFLKRYAFAVKEMEALLFNHFTGQFRATSLIDDHRLGVFGNAITAEAGANYMGIQLEFNPCDVYFKFEISEVSLRLNSAGAVSVLIYDLRQDKLLETLSITAVSGEIVTSYLHSLFYASKEPMNLFIGYNAAGITSVKTPIKTGLCCGKKSCANSYLTATGVTLSGGFNDSNVTAIDHTGGLSIVYSIACDHSKWLCAYARTFALPLAYKTAAIMISDGLMDTGGERASNSQTIGYDEMKSRYNFYLSKFDDTFSSVLSNMRLPSNRCFQCNTPVSHKSFAI